MIRTVGKCRNFQCGSSCILYSFRVLRTACLTVSVIAAVTARTCGAAQQASGDYATDLGSVYAGYQEIVALKEACDEAVGRTRVNEQAYTEWRERHKELLAEIKRRVRAMVRAASRDEREYARNVGKYEGAILHAREEHKLSFLSLGAKKLRAECGRIPELLKSPNADLKVIFAGELETIRRRE